MIKPDDPRHGRHQGYQAGCRETCCKTAHAIYRRAERKRTIMTGPASVSALGTQRRINALQAIGWTQEALALQGGWRNADDVNEIMKRKRVTVRTARRIAALYHDLENTPGPSKRSIAYAARQGWPPPIAWDDIDRQSQPKDWRREMEKISQRDIDPFVIETVLSGTSMPMTVDERREVVRTLTNRRRTPAEISDYIGVPVTTIDQDIRRMAC